MAKAIFTTKITPSYNDLPELMYHFPKTYLRQATLTIGDWIVYYEPRREDLSPAGHAGRQCYFATARVTHIKEDVALKDHYYAFVENYVEFSAPVPFKIGSYYYESGLKKADGSTNKGAFGRAVRIIQDEEYQAIVAAGLAQINEKNKQEVAEPLVTFDSKRPVIQQIIERPFREAAFARLVKEEYGLTCAMTGITIKNDRGITEVEAAHIRPVKFNGPDSARNGIALCRTFHWMFDHGLISVADSGDIIVKNIVPPKIYQLLNTNGKIRVPSNIEQNKERYYETLEQSSQGWHEGQHDPWPYINFILFILKTAYREFVERVGDIQAPRGSKTEMVLSVLRRLPREFTVAQLEQACPGVSRDMVRRVLGEQKGKSVECIGRGPGAKWTKKG